MSVRYRRDKGNLAERIASWVVPLIVARAEVKGMFHFWESSSAVTGWCRSFGSGCQVLEEMAGDMLQIDDATARANSEGINVFDT